jgi:hypothetical protein
MKAPDRHILALEPFYEMTRSILVDPLYPIGAGTRNDNVSAHLVDKI